MGNILPFIVIFPIETIVSDSNFLEIAIQGDTVSSPLLVYGRSFVRTYLVTLYGIVIDYITGLYGKFWDKCS